MKKITRIEVCHGTTCGTHGAQRIKRLLQDEYKEVDTVIIERTCCGRCKFNNTIVVDGVAVSRLSPETVKEKFVDRPEQALEDAKRDEEAILEELNSFLESDDLLTS